MTYRKAYCKATRLVDQAIEIIHRQNEQISEMHGKLNMEFCKYQKQVSHSEELQTQLNAAKEMNTENLRLLDSYMQNNSRQAQDIIELEAVAIALYDVLWHMVYSVEDEIKDKNVTNLNAYKTIVALFEAEGED